MTAAAPLTARPGTVPIPYRVVEREAETPDTTTIVLEPVRSALQPFAPGQFAMVYAFGVGDIPLSVSGIDGRRLRRTPSARSERSPGHYTGCGVATRSGFAARSAPAGNSPPQRETTCSSWLEVSVWHRCARSYATRSPHRSVTDG